MSIIAPINDLQWPVGRTEPFMGKSYILLLTLAVSAFGQTSADLSAKYPHVTAYIVRPNVL